MRAGACFSLGQIFCYSNNQSSHCSTCSSAETLKENNVRETKGRSFLSSMTQSQHYSVKEHDFINIVIVLLVAALAEVPCLQLEKQRGKVHLSKNPHRTNDMM